MSRGDIKISTTSSFKNEIKNKEIKYVHGTSSTKFRINNKNKKFIRKHKLICLKLNQKLLRCAD